jgi:hypothetical protein
MVEISMEVDKQSDIIIVIIVVYYIAKDCGYKTNIKQQQASFSIYCPPSIFTYISVQSAQAFTKYKKNVE